MAQWIKNLPAVQEAQEMWVQSLGWEESLEEENGNPLQYSCLKNPMDSRAWQAYSLKDCKESDTTERLPTHKHKSYMRTILCPYFSTQHNQIILLFYRNCHKRKQRNGNDHMELSGEVETEGQENPCVLMRNLAPSPACPILCVITRWGTKTTEWAMAAGTVGVSPGIQNKFSYLFLTTWCRK